MRLLKIGRAPENDIVLSSQYASNFHAELYLLDNGDILLVDAGSSNGTFVNGAKVTSGKEVAVTRKDKVTFADQMLDWSQVAPIRISSDVKSLLGIGTHYLNRIQISGSGVSRFHATICEKKDGKWYIKDHSTNGTSVNGVRIPKNQEFRINKGDDIRCGGVHVVNPVKKTSSSSSGLWIAVACLAILLVSGAGTFAFFKNKYIDKPIAGVVTPEKIYAKYSPAVALINIGFHFHVTAPLGIVDAYYVVKYDRNGELSHIEPYIKGRTPCMEASATGFFISEDGKLVTNLHVADPSLYGTEKDIAEILKLDIARSFKGSDLVVSYSDLEVTTEFDYIHVYPNGVYYNDDNCTNCLIVKQSEDKNVDLSIFQTVTKRLPQGASYVDLKIKTNLPVATKIITIGYPLPEFIQDNGKKTVFYDKPVEATYSSGSISNIFENTYGYDAVSASGASGSPVFDNEGYLVGVASKGYVGGKEFNRCEKAENIVSLLK